MNNRTATENVIKEEDHVVLVKNFDSSNMKIIQVISNSSVHYGKLHFDVNPLIGANFGSVYEIKGQTMVPVENFEDYDIELSDLVSKKMSTLNDKSQFSQEKIIKKKKRKSHANIVTVMRPTLLHINEMLFARDKIGGLREDVLAQIITLSNIQDGTNCLILDHNLGLITSAVMSRILPNGVCVQVLTDYESMCTSRRTMNMLNIKESECMNNLLSITIRDLHKLIKGEECFEQDNDVLRNRSKEQIERITRHSAGESTRNDSSKRTKLEPDASQRLLETLIKKDANRENRNRERLDAARLLKERTLDSLIIIAQYDHPLTILKMLFRFIAFSRQFVVYCDYPEPLVECHRYLKANAMAVSLQLSESWMRRHQVVPDRTRPEMNSSGYGGFLLSGIKVDFAE